MSPRSVSSAQSDPDHEADTIHVSIGDEQTVRTLDDRYGTRRNRRADKRVGIGLASALVAAGIAFLAFDGMPTAESAIEFQDIAHRIEDDNIHASLTFELTAPIGSNVSCEIQALNPSFAIVGYRLLELPPSDKLTRGVTEKLVTTNLATTVTVSHCWVETSDT